MVSGGGNGDRDLAPVSDFPSTAWILAPGINAAARVSTAVQCKGRLPKPAFACMSTFS